MGQPCAIIWHRRADRLIETGVLEHWDPRLRALSKRRAVWMVGIQLVIIVALIEYLVMGYNVGQARGTYNIKAPATTGHPTFERLFRVHQNMLEQLIVFIPALLIFCHRISVRWGIVLGVLFLIARPLHAIGYVRDPEKRVYGAGLTAVVNAILVTGSIIGLLVAL
jgi:glutathione S-transferase